MPKKGLNQAVIIQAAVGLAEQKGLENITLRELADCLGVKTASLYNHLNGIPELNVRLAEFALSKLDAEVRNAAVGRSKKDALMAIARAYRAFAGNFPELYKAILNLPKLDDVHLTESGRSVMRILTQVLEQYSLTQEETLHFSRGFRSAMHGFVSLEAAGFFTSRVNADESYQRFIQQLIRTLPEKSSEQGRLPEQCAGDCRENT